MKKQITFLLISFFISTAFSYSQNRPIMEYDTVCSNTCEILSPNATTGFWTAYQQGASIPLIPQPFFSPSNTSPNPTVTIAAYSGLHNSIEFVWTDDGGTSNDYTILVVFARQPNASVGEVNQLDICGDCVSLNADTIGSGWANGYWVEQNLIGSWEEGNQNQPNVTFCGISLNYGDSAYVSTDFLWVMSNYGCRDIDTLHVTFYESNKPDAGSDNAVCGNTYLLQADYSIDASNNYTPTGEWSIYSKPLPSAEAVFSQQENNITNVTVSHYGIYQFVFTETNSNLPSCSQSDTIMIEFVETPVIFAGEDQHICGTCAQLECVSAGFSGFWLSAPVNFDSYSDPNTNVCVASSGGEWTFTWMESNMSMTNFSMACTSSDEVTITFYKIPTANIITSPTDSVVCGLYYDLLRAENPGSGITGYWFNNNPETEFEDRFDLSTGVTVSDYGYHNFYWIEEAGPIYAPGLCTDTAGPFTIHFIEKPIANAGSDTLFCGYSGYLNAIPSVGTGLWSNPSLENISIADQNDPNTLITSNIFNPGHPSTQYFNLVWTENNYNGCTDIDTVKVIFAKIPNSTIEIIPPKCFGEPATITAIEDSLQYYTWNFFNGIIDSSTTNNQGGKFENFVYWNSEDTLHSISLITTNFWGCQSPITIDTVYEPPVPDFNIIIISDTCMLGQGALIFTDTLGNNSFLWLDTVYGPSAGSYITTVYNLPTGEYDIRTSYLTPNMFYYSYYMSTFGTTSCIDTITIEVGSYNLFDLSCPEDIEITNEQVVQLITLPNLYPLGGSFYIDGIETTVFNTTNYDNGVYNVSYLYYDVSTDCHGVCNFNIILEIDVNVSQYKTEILSIFPNPATDCFTISGNNTTPFNVSVVDVNGKTMLEVTDYNGGEIKLNNFRAGIYFVKIQSTQVNVCKKLVVN